MRILAVDDDFLSLALLRETLLDAGHDVFVAKCGESALELLQHNHLDIVISDWEMPGINGLELARRLRLLGLSSYVYFMLLSGNDSESERELCLKDGVDDYITKPFDPDKLLSRITAAAERVKLINKAG